MWGQRVRGGEVATLSLVLVLWEGVSMDDSVADSVFITRDKGCKGIKTVKVWVVVRSLT